MGKAISPRSIRGLPTAWRGCAKAILLAGARSLTLSLWEVPATETARQIGDFHTRWLGENRRALTTRYGACRAAQLAALARARQTFGAGHPFYWAGMVDVGDPPRIAIKR